RQENTRGNFSIFVKLIGGGNPGPRTPSGVYLPAEARRSRVLASVLNNNFAVASKGIYFIPTSSHTRFNFTASSVVRRRLSQSSQRNQPGACPSHRMASRWLCTEFEGVRADLVLMENFR